MRYVAAAILVLSVLQSCKSRVERSSLADSQLRTTIAYHMGALNDLQQLSAEKVRSGWQQIGSVKNPPGGSYRRGFYLSTHPTLAEGYADPGTPWFMTVVLDNECLDTFTDLTTVPKLPDCDSADYRSISGVNNACDQVTTAYLDSKGVKLVADTVHPGAGFFYVRDPKCIRVAEASPESVLSAFADVPGMWSKKPSPTLRERISSSMAMVHILRQALLLSTTKDAEAMRRMAKNVGTCDVSLYHCWWAKFITFAGLSSLARQEYADYFKKSFATNNLDAINIEPLRTPVEIAVAASNQTLEAKPSLQQGQRPVQGNESASIGQEKFQELPDLLQQAGPLIFCTGINPDNNRRYRFQLTNLGSVTKSESYGFEQFDLSKVAFFAENLDRIPDGVGPLPGFLRMDDTYPTLFLHYPNHSIFNFIDIRFKRDHQKRIVGIQSVAIDPRSKGGVSRTVRESECKGALANAVK